MNVTGTRCLISTVVFAAVALTVAACAPVDLGRTGSPEAIAAALGRSTAVPTGPVNKAGRPVAYLALGGPRGSRLAAFDLAQSRLLWEVPAPMTGRLVAGASVVAYADGTALVARDVTSGAVVWRNEIATGETLVGYAADGDTITYVARQGHELRGGASDLVALRGLDGVALWRRPLGTSNVGGPAARGGIVAVPNRSQFITLMDESTGQPLGQVLSKEQAADFVQALPEGFFYGYGSDGFYLLSPETAVGVRSSVGHLQAKFPAFVRPSYHFDMYRPDFVAYTALDRNRVLWRAEVQGARAAFAGGLACVLNYRFFFGFDARSGELRWAYNNPLVEAVSAAHTGRAIVFATADGELGALATTTGRRQYRARLPGEVIVGATFDAEGFAPRGGDGSEAQPLVGVLESIIWDPDRRFSEAQLFAVDQLARIPGRQITADLLKMLAQEDLPVVVAKRAARAVVDRKDKESIDLFVEALRVHADYAAGTKTAYLDVLARAVGALEAREAAEPLAAHLRLPETEPAAVVEIARALSMMHAVETLPALRDYLSIYRADSSYEGDPSALLAVVDTLAKLGGAAEKELLLYVAEEPRTLSLVREHARHALSRMTEGAPTAPGSSPAPVVPARLSPAPTAVHEPLR